MGYPQPIKLSLPEALKTVRTLQDELAETNREVLLLTLDLEQRVAERTRQLEATNESLKKEILERQRAEKEILQLNEALEKRASELEFMNRELEAFTYSVSHDLRGPLRHIGGFAAILMEDAEDRLIEEDRDNIRTICRAADKMSRLIDDLLLFSRMARSELRGTNVDLSEMVSQIVKDQRPDVEGRNVEWKIDPLPVVYGDAAMLRLVFVNLISNAIKYAGPRDPAVIEIGVLEEDSVAFVFFVRDNGVGFDPAYMDKLFGVFQRLHREDEFPGTGIGLANVKRIVERHGGQVWAEAKVDEGATFYFSLPKSKID